MEKKIGNREECWRERIAGQERSSLSVRQLCGQQQITAQSFYYWRKRLREREPMRFALVETGAVRPQPPADPVLEFLWFDPVGNRAERTDGTVKSHGLGQQFPP